MMKPRSGPHSVLSKELAPVVGLSAEKPAAQNYHTCGSALTSAMNGGALVPDAAPALCPAAPGGTAASSTLQATMFQ